MLSTRPTHGPANFLARHVEMSLFPQALRFTGSKILITSVSISRLRGSDDRSTARESYTCVGAGSLEPGCRHKQSPDLTMEPPFLIRAGCLTIVSSCEADQKSAAIKVPFELWSALESCVDTTGCQFLLLVAQGKFRDTSVHLRNLVWLPSQSRASGDGLKLHAVASCHWVF
jgi:hypothetical protein